MPISATCAAVIPCLNEGETIARLVSEVGRHLSPVIVVDDGSRDNTAAAANAAGATVLRRGHNHGKGSALSTGFRHALSHGCDWALAMDGDGQHCPQDILSFVSGSPIGDTRMIVGNRMGSACRMPFVRRWVNRWMSARISRYCGCPLPDSQCGFRLVHLPSWNQFNFRAEHFEIESELLVRFLRAGLKVEFVPIQTVYGRERSKIHPLRDTIRWFRWWRAIRHELATEFRAPFIFSKTPDVSGAAAK
jgi:glycosyltransferase involved in cell wall biosynthesis